MSHAVPTTVALLRAVASMGWSCYPVLLVPFARVKLQDEVGQILGARLSLMLLGERPGLGSPDSLGAYFTYRPERTRTDADRNCLSNIRTEGLAPELAAAKLATLLYRAMEQKATGVQLKDEGEILAGLAPSSQSISRQS
jgi:ethanolamine ammonia-lyase small subunit